jgi:hypothetical protein
VILVSDDARPIVLQRADDGTPCDDCGSPERVVAVDYQVFGFFRAFCTSWGRWNVVHLAHRTALDISPAP